ncbi:MAG: response regulator transcription factor [Verrucomicrobiaceae bacterium]|nr:response regulator transcription factor [Verrucomicrobiaceae bacterium]
MKTRLFLAINQRCFRDLLGMALRTEGHFEIMAEPTCGMEILEKCAALRPDIVISDLKFSDMSAAELSRRLRHEAPEVRVLVFSGSGNEALTREVLAARPHGFVHREEPLNEFYEALRAVARGTRFFSNFASSLLDAPSDPGAGRKNGYRLTPREREVLALLARGLSSKEIGSQLGLSPKTVDHYRADLMSKLDIHDVAGLTRYAITAGVLKAGA